MPCCYYIDGNVHVVDGLERRALCDASGMQHLDEVEVRVRGDVCFELVAQPADLLPMRLRVLALEVYPVVGERGDVLVRYPTVEREHPSVPVNVLF